MVRRLLFFAALLFGIFTMHTIGHPTMPAMPGMSAAAEMGTAAPVAAHEHPAPPSAAAPVERGRPRPVTITALDPPTARAVLRTARGGTPGKDARPAESDRPPLTAGRSRAAPSTGPPTRQPDATVALRLTGGMATYDWGFNGERSAPSRRLPGFKGERYDPSRRLPVRFGDRVRLSFRNGTAMWHPVHPHGHAFASPNGGPRKDTAVVPPRQTPDVEFGADDPGLWMIHCHNVHHAESGMMTLLGYRR